MKTTLVTIIALIASSFSLAAASLVGDTIQVRREIPLFNFLAGPFTTAVVTGGSDTLSLTPSDNLYLNPESSSFMLMFGPNGGSGGSIFTVLHRIVISDIDWFGEPDRFIAGVSASSDVPGFNTGLVSFDAHSVTLNIAPFEWVGGESVLLQLTPSIVPEPTVFSLFGIGLLLFAVANTLRSNVKGCSGGEARALRLHPWLNKPGL